MSAAGRLWRRAPLWRLCIGATLTFGALTALYPTPGIERVFALIQGAPATTSRVVGPTMIPSLRTLTPLAGRSLPLPAGDWHEVLAGRFEPDGEVTEIVLARLQHGRVSGLLDAIATTGPSAASPGLPVQCADPTNFASHVLPVRPDGTRSCWFVRAAPAAMPVADGQPRSILDAARERLREVGTEPPVAMTRSVWFRTGDREFMSVQIDLPAPRKDRVEAWMKGWTVLLDQGFDGTLKPSGVLPRLARDPAS